MQMLIDSYRFNVLLGQSHNA